jgi:hypothetical protein
VPWGHTAESCPRQAQRQATCCLGVHPVVSLHVCGHEDGGVKLHPGTQFICSGTLEASMLCKKREKTFSHNSKRWTFGGFNSPSPCLAGSMLRGIRKSPQLLWRTFGACFLAPACCKRVHAMCWLTINRSWLVLLILLTNCKCALVTWKRSGTMVTLSQFSHEEDPTITWSDLQWTRMSRLGTLYFSSAGISFRTASLVHAPSQPVCKKLSTYNVRERLMIRG